MHGARTTTATRPDGGGDCAAAWAHVRAVVAGSGTSFYWAMRLLPRERREGMYAVYAYCREIDDIADEPGRPQDKLAALDRWRQEIERLYAGMPRFPTTRALLRPVCDYGLPREEFLALIDGMEMDARETMRAPGMAELELYCRRVAGAVGMLALRVFGAGRPEAEGFAVALGDAFQLTNILRDLEEDAGRGRLYVARELLLEQGIDDREPQAAMARPGFAAACDALADMAATRFERARALIPAEDVRALRPALVMMHVYERLLRRLVERGFERLDVKVRVSALERLGLALRFGLFPP